jgi:hypothetical protein
MEMESTANTDAQMESTIYKQMLFILPAYPYPHTMEERAITKILQNFWIRGILF